MTGESNKSPLTGYNHNLKYKGRIYHVQTEDSGLSSPHVFTHLFFDGTIIATKKTDYHDVAQAQDWADKVRKIMQGSHKDMMKGLLKGNFDEKIVQYFGVLEVQEQGEAQQKPPPPKPAPAPKEEKKPPSPTQAPPLSSIPPSRPTRSMSARARARARDKAAEEGKGRSSVVAAPVVVVSGMKSPPPKKGGQPPTSEESRRQSHVYTARGRRETPLKPEQSKPVPENIFGDVNVVDEKSLDEVILAYLSEDLPED